MHADVCTFVRVDVRVQFVCLTGVRKSKHVTERSSADCSLRAAALTTGPAVPLHPGDASDSLYGSRPGATAHRG